MNNLLICVPCRYNSSRLPGKPLLKINGLSIVNLVFLNIMKINNIKKSNIIFLTDDERIYNEVIGFGANCYVSKQDCENGTIRIINYLKENEINKKYILNIQGDEPYFDVNMIQKLIELFIDRNKRNHHVKCGTLYYNSNDYNYVNNKNKVKLVLNNQNFIMYGSRQVIPGTKKDVDSYENKINYYIHIGIFIFDFHYLLNEYIQPNIYYQNIEDLEWLKILEQDYKIYSLPVQFHEVGVDTEEDYLYLKNKYEKKPL